MSHQANSLLPHPKIIEKLTAATICRATSVKANPDVEALIDSGEYQSGWNRFIRGFGDTFGQILLK